MIRKINGMSPKPKFFVICGDMLDAFPYVEHPGGPKPFPGVRDMREKQYQDFVKVIQELDPAVKLVCVCGNHDIGDIPSKDTLEIYRRQFGQDYFTFWVGGVKFIVLNSQYLHVPGALPEETEKQAEFMKTIEDPKAKHIGKTILKLTFPFTLPLYPF